MDAPQGKINHEISNFLWDVAEFVFRNIFGILSALSGIAYQIYQMSGRTLRMTKTQCVSSVMMWFISSMAIVIGMENVGMNKLFYGLICWSTPIVIKPIADTISVKASPVTEKIVKALESLLTSHIKNQKP